MCPFIIINTTKYKIKHFCPSCPVLILYVLVHKGKWSLHRINSSILQHLKIVIFPSTECTFPARSTAALPAATGYHHQQLIIGNYIKDKLYIYKYYFLDKKKNIYERNLIHLQQVSEYKYFSKQKETSPFKQNCLSVRWCILTVEEGHEDRAPGVKI